MPEPEIIKKDYNRKIYNRFQILKGVEPPVLNDLIQERAIIVKTEYPAGSRLRESQISCKSCLHFHGSACLLHREDPATTCPENNQTCQGLLKKTQ
jgi:hypothetical protein